MKKTRETHGLWESWEKLPPEIRQKLSPLVGKWHYHYENENGRIGLVRLNNLIPRRFGKIKESNHCYEACGVLDFEQFKTIRDAEVAIYDKLGEIYSKIEPTKVISHL